MDYRNLNRSLVINKALRKFAKGNFSIKQTELYILLAVAHGNDSCTLIRAYLMSFYRTYPLDMITNTLKRFISLGLIIRKDLKYNLSFAGQTVLKDLELLVRDTRIDK